MLVILQGDIFGISGGRKKGREHKKKHSKFNILDQIKMTEVYVEKKLLLLLQIEYIWFIFVTCLTSVIKR
jgi:hypothetical protein